MKKISHIILPLLCLGLFILSSCHTSQKAVNSEKEYSFENMNWSPEKVAWAIENRQIDYHTLSARLHIDFKSEEKEFNNVTTYLRMKKDSVIWLSVRPFLGIEMLRIFITPDSIKIRNNIKGRTIVRGSEDFADILHVPFAFSAVQSLIMGNPKLALGKKKNIEIDSTTIHAQFPGKLVQRSFEWTKKGFLLRKSYYKETNGNKYAEQNFEDYKKFKVGQVSLKRNIIVEAEKKIKVHLSFDKVKFNVPVTFPFS